MEGQWHYNANVVEENERMCDRQTDDHANSMDTPSTQHLIDENSIHYGSASCFRRLSAAVVPQLTRIESVPGLQKTDVVNIKISDIKQVRIFKIKGYSPSTDSMCHWTVCPQEFSELLTDRVRAIRQIESGLSSRCIQFSLSTTHYSFSCTIPRINNALRRSP